MTNSFFNRDISWLSFNERLLIEADTDSVPLMERIKFLSIFSSNLDEFYRVRMPALTALYRISKKTMDTGNASQINVFDDVTRIVHRQQDKFGSVLNEKIIPQLKRQGIHLVYNEPIPDFIRKKAIACFFESISAYLKIAFAGKGEDFFPQNNQLYMVVTIQNAGRERIAFVNIPASHTGRFCSFHYGGVQYIIFIDDIIKVCLPHIFSKDTITGAFNIKVTRDAALDLLDEYEVDLAEKIEEQINKRDYGLATRLLYQPDLPSRILEQLKEHFHLMHATTVAGGNYHHLKDLAALPVYSAELQYAAQPALEYRFREEGNTLFEEIELGDVLIHTPYQSYNTVLRFFNEAAIDDEVEEIFTTLYRVASESRIVNALISAVSNGKKVTVFVELKARFDEANNLKWAKKMKAAGVKVIYSIPGLKVHAKVALVKRKRGGKDISLGLFATGNLNEITAGFYTDHILLTAHVDMVEELEVLFNFLGHRKKTVPTNNRFSHLLVSQFNLQERFLHLIDAEIAQAAKGQPAGIIIKLNNLEEEVLISKLYEASAAGVKIKLLIRSVCCLIPGVEGMSENIMVKRIVDRYLEHGRIFIFHNSGKQQIYLGSADWMNRNIYRRIEVCFPLYNEQLKKEIRSIIDLQLQDNASAVWLDETMNNRRPDHENNGHPIRSQSAIYEYLQLHL